MKQFISKINIDDDVGLNIISIHQDGVEIINITEDENELKVKREDMGKIEEIIIHGREQNDQSE